jgi:hypothetical protein
MDSCERRVWPGLMLVDADVILHRGVDRGDCENFLRPVVGWRIDVPRRQDPQPVWVFLFEVFSDLLAIV